jgi:hypothetical protein
LIDLVQNSLVDADGFAGDDVWYSRTTDHIYPDALANLFHSVHTPRVGHTADVLVSMKDGYYYGSSLFGRFVTLAATHGNAMRSSTSAFLMSTHRPLPNTIRASEARAYLKD